MIFKSTVRKATRHGELEPYFTLRVARFNDKMGFVLGLTRQSQWQQVVGTVHSSVHEQENLLI